MPQIEYVVLADYVRQDAGLTHIMAAGLDTFTLPPDRLPAAVPVGVAVRITFDSRDQVGSEHQLRLAFSPVEGDDLLVASSSFPTPPAPPGVPDHWRTALSVAFRLALPLPALGNYRLTVTLDDNPLQARSIDVRAISAAAPQR
jgi:hypothetical protein